MIHPATMEGPIYQRRIQAVKDLLSTLSCSSVDVEVKLGMSARWAERILRFMHEQEMIHIDDWTECPRTGDKIALFALGAGIDAQLPKRKRGTAKNHDTPSVKFRHRRPPGLSKDELEERKIKRMNMRLAKEIQPFRDPMTAALFGPPVTARIVAESPDKDPDYSRVLSMNGKSQNHGSA